jgi:hypothetical protein
MPDGRAVAYVDAATQTSLWAQPLDGVVSHQLTHVNDGPTIAAESGQPATSPPRATNLSRPADQADVGRLDER